MITQKQIDARDTYIRFLEDMYGTSLEQYKINYKESVFKQAITDADKDSEQYGNNS